MPTQQQSNSSILAELYKFNSSSIIELFELDLSPLKDYYASKGTPITTMKYYFHNGYNQKYGTASADVKWGSPEITYVAKPMQIEGVQASSAGEIARPTLTVSTLDSNLLFNSLCKTYANLVGAKITRIRTLVKFLNSSNFASTNLLTSTDTLNIGSPGFSPSSSVTSITLNAGTAPDGSLTAEKLFENATSPNTHGIVQNLTVGNNVNVCCSIFLKAAERTNGTIYFKNKAGTLNGKTFNLSNGTISSTTRGTVLGSGITNFGNGWYRCWIVCSSGTGAVIPTMEVYTDNESTPASVSYSGTTSSGIFVWGPQAEVISNSTNTPTIYQAVGFSPFTNPTEDTQAKFPDDVYYIDRMSQETPGEMVFELAPAWDVEGVQLPRRQVVANICPWTYKKKPCSWSAKGVISGSFTGTAASSSRNITGYINGTTLNVSVTDGTIIPGMFVSGTGVITRTKIVSGPSAGGVGDYIVDKSQIIGSATSTISMTLSTTGIHYAISPQASPACLGEDLKVKVQNNGSSYLLAVQNTGKNYSVGETFTIPGSTLGGTDVSNSITFTITVVSSDVYYTADDVITTDAAQDACGKRYSSCRLRFGSRALPFGGFPSAGLYGKPI